MDPDSSVTGASQGVSWKEQIGIEEVLYQVQQKHVSMLASMQVIQDTAANQKTEDVTQYKIIAGKDIAG